MRCKVIRKESFNAAHRLHNPKWSDEKNAAFYDKCNYPNFHGHNYLLEVHVTGPVDPESGYVMDMKVLASLIKKHIHDKFDHKNLNLDIPEFKEVIPTAENIAKLSYEILRPLIDSHLDISLVLHETEKNIVEYPVA